MNDLRRIKTLLEADRETLDAKARASVHSVDGLYDAAKASGIQHAIEVLDSEMAIAALNNTRTDDLDWVWYEGWVCDFRPGGRGADKNPTLRGAHEQQFFVGRNMGDPSRSNVQTPGQLGTVDANHVEAVGVIATFTDQQLLEAFFRGSTIEVFVGHKAYFQAPTAMLLNGLATAAGAAANVRKALSKALVPSVGHQVCAVHQVRGIEVAPRVNFNLRMTIDPSLGDLLHAHQEEAVPGSYAGFLWLIFSRRHRRIQ